MASDARRLTVAFCTRELWPFVTGGGIGRAKHGTIRLLAAHADVTVITREAFHEQYEEMRADDDPRLPHPDVRFSFVPDPTGIELGPFTSFQHCWSARLFERLGELFPDGGPDLAEFSDYLGEGFVTFQARRSGHPSVRNTRCLLRLDTTLEIVNALNNGRNVTEELRSIYSLERGSVALADHILSPGGNVLEIYSRFYGPERVAVGSDVPHVIAEGAGAHAPTPAPVGTPTRLLFVGRLERRKGVCELVEAATRLGRDDWHLALVGGDTDSAPDGGSMRAHLDRLAGGHDRIEFHEPVPHERVLELIDQHHVVVIPSRWECWSNVAREALLRNRPIVATPTGALMDAVRPGASGWLTPGTTADDIGRALERVLASREDLDALIASGSPRKLLDELMKPEATLAAYRELAAAAASEDVAAPDQGDQSVSAVVVIAAGTGSPTVTVRALERQTRPVQEVVVACDGIERLAPGLDTSRIDALELGPCGSPPATRNAGLEAASGQLLLLLDAGIEPAPELVERLVAALANDPDAAYATAWAEGVSPSAAPLGNLTNLVPEYDNAAVAPLLRRDVLERGHRFDASLGGCASRAFYAGLAADGLFGSVLPERLISWAPVSTPCADDVLEHSLLPKPRTEPMSWTAG